MGRARPQAVDLALALGLVLVQATCSGGSCLLGLEALLRRSQPAGRAMAQAADLALALVLVLVQAAGPLVLLPPSVALAGGLLWTTTMQQQQLLIPLWLSVISFRTLKCPSVWLPPTALLTRRRRC